MAYRISSYLPNQAYLSHEQIIRGPAYRLTLFRLEYYVQHYNAKSPDLWELRDDNVSHQKLNAIFNDI